MEYTANSTRACLASFSPSQARQMIIQYNFTRQRSGINSRGSLFDWFVFCCFCSPTHSLKISIFPRIQKYEFFNESKDRDFENFLPTSNFTKIFLRMANQ
jgi:hypothetical protein